MCFNSQHINRRMKCLRYAIAILLTSTILSCSSTQRSIKEPNATIRFDKEEFDYSPQLSASATSTKILGIDWHHLFNRNAAITARAQSTFLYGTAPSSQTESLALYEIIQQNPSYDFIVYPQYQVKKVSPAGLGLFYKKIEVTATARLAVMNDYYSPKAGNAYNALQAKEWSATINNIQSAYDALFTEMSELKDINYTSNIVINDEVYDPNDPLEKERQAYLKQFEKEDLTATLNEDIANFSENSKTKVTVQSRSNIPSSTTSNSTSAARSKASTTPVSKVENKVTPTPTPTKINQSYNASRTNITLPPGSSSITTNSSKTLPQEAIKANTYLLVLASFDDATKAQIAQAQLSRKLYAYNKAIGIVNVNGKYRIGFINFNTREECFSFRSRLTQKHPEYKDAWPFKP